MTVGGVGASREPDRNRIEPPPDAGPPDEAANDANPIAEVAPEPVVTPVPSAEIVEDARAIARADEAAVRAHMETGFEVGDSAPLDVNAAVTPVPFGQTLAGLPHDAASHLTSRVAEDGGLERPPSFGTQTLSDYEVRLRAESAGALGLQLDAAREAGDAESVEWIETEIADRFGDNGLPAVNAAIEAANEAGPRPNQFAPRSGYAEQDAYSAAITEALTPLAVESRYRDHVGHEQAAAIDAAYADMSPEDRARLDTELEAFMNDRNFFEGAWQAIEDTGSDVYAVGELAWNLSTDSEARTEFRENVGLIADALADPEQRAETLELIGTELGQGVVEAFTDFENDPDYYTGYLAGTLAAGGGLGRLARVGAVAARLGGDRLTGLADRLDIMGPPGGFTRPTLTPSPNNRPEGPLTRVPENEVPENRRALTLENETAQTLAELGYDIRQNPPVPGPANPDYLIDGRLFDNYAPRAGTNARSIWTTVQNKVERQAPGIVLTLDDSAIDIADLRRQFDQWPIEGLEQLIIMRNGEVIDFPLRPGALVPEMAVVPLLLGTEEREGEQ